MASNETFPYLNSTSQPDLWSTCPAEEIFAWQQRYLTPTNFILLVIAIVLETPMCLVATSLNVLMILAVWRKRYLRKQRHCVLLACLAATDLLVGTVVLPLVITGHIMRLVGAGPLCVVDKITRETLRIACGASLFHVAIISGERYVAIKHALRYEALVTTSRLNTAVAAAWAVGPVLKLFSTVSLEVSGEAAPPEMAILTTVGTLLTCVVVFSVAYCQVAIFLESRRHLKHIATHQVSEAAAREILKKDKAARTTIIIVGALCLCYAASAIGLVAATMTSSSARGSALASLYTAQLLVCFNSLINPIIYCVRTQDFRRAFGELLNLETSQVNPEFVIQRNRRLKREGTTVRPMSSRKNKLPNARSVTRAACHSRSRSLDLSSDPTHVKTRRTNSM